MIKMDKRIIELAILALQTKQVAAWVDHYDAGEDGKFHLHVILYIAICKQKYKSGFKPTVMQTFSRIELSSPNCHRLTRKF